MIKIEIRQVDGGYHEFSGDDELYQRMLALQNEGIRGKELIDSLLPGERSSPPTVVTLHGTDSAGKEFRHVLSYD